MSLGTRNSFPLRARVARHQSRPPDANPRLQNLHRSRVDYLLGGRDGPRARRLLAFLQSMTLQDGAALLAHVRLDDWLEADRDARADALSIISARIVHLRERAGLPPFDDPLPGDRDNVFLTLRKMLGDR
jgi:hypothetical protein